MFKRCGLLGVLLVSIMHIAHKLCAVMSILAVVALPVLCCEVNHSTTPLPSMLFTKFWEVHVEFNLSAHAIMYVF